MNPVAYLCSSWWLSVTMRNMTVNHWRKFRGTVDLPQIPGRDLRL
ncbi:hypothetical protein AB3R30_20285 [Leptolyngbyaceae cyanobacterium UHCC 1019]